MNPYGLLELSEPVSFEPVGPVTSVFYDAKNKQILSIQRNPSSLDLHNFDAGGQIDAVEYTLVPKNKNSPIHSFLWTGPTELVTVSELGIDIYSVVPGKKLIKYVRSSSTAISWAVTCPETNTIVTSSKQETNNLQIWSIRNSSIVKLPSIELPSTKNIKEKDVSVINVYGKSFIGINEKDEEIVKSLKLYSTENDQVILAHSLNFDGISGPLGIQTVDNLVLVHSLQGSCTHIFDIAVTGGNDISYSPTWVVFQPNIIVDARNGQLFTVNLKVKRAVSGNAVTLCRFLLHRHSGKQQVLLHLKSCLADDSVSLENFSMMFQEIWRAYCGHQNPSDQALLYCNSMVNCYGKLEGSPVVAKTSVVLDQADIYTSVIVTAEQNGVELTRIQAVIVELLLSLALFKLKPRQFILEMFINLAVKTQQLYQMHQYIQYGVITDSKHLACIILSLENVYPPARQIALDMMSRLGAAEELIEICLAEGKVVEALNLARETGLADTISASKYLEASKDLDPLTYFNVFSFFEERNMRLRGTPNFPQEDNCQDFVHQFKTMFICMTENGENKVK